MSTDIDSILKAQTNSFSQTRSSSDFLRVVYAWMMGGLLLTSAAAFFCLQSEEFFLTIYRMRTILIIAELGLVLWLSARISAMSVTTARAIFLSYSLLNGLTMSAILALYEPTTVISAFLSASLMFGATSIYGMVTKRDLSSVGSFFFMGLIGIIIAGLVNMFLQSPALHFAISIVGVLVFVGLTAWDTQKIKEMQVEVEGSEASGRIAIMGALTLYLDFINMFLFILRILGRRR